jgi:hypothetical protein
VFLPGFVGGMGVTEVGGVDWENWKGLAQEGGGDVGGEESGSGEEENKAQNKSHPRRDRYRYRMYIRRMARLARSHQV